ncbi:MAG: c-type cytochrome [Alphaproteobacteria bacterium]
MTFLRIMGFSLAVLLSFTILANILPQVQSDPPEEEEIDTGALDLAGQVAWGERLFTGKGTCTLCHNNLGRAPDLLVLDLSEAFPQRLADSRYAGAAADLEGAEAIEVYLRESMIEPSAYVVGGFGKKGTNDAVSPMPKADGAPISLAALEMDAIVAFLQDKSGFEVTVALPSEDSAAVAEAEEADEEEGPAETAEAVLENNACGACHDIAGSGADIGPALAGIGERLDREGLRQAILQPNADIVEGYEADIMPQDLGTYMWAVELEMVIDYLLALQSNGEAN